MCRNHSCDQGRAGTCMCTNGSWMLSDCSLSVDNIVEKVADVERSTQQRIRVYAQNMRTTQMCSDPHLAIFCNITAPHVEHLNQAPSLQHAGQCVALYKDCFQKPTLPLLTTTQHPCKNDTATHLCLRNGCVSGQGDCMFLAARCSIDVPYRCNNWTCAQSPDAAGCGTHQGVCTGSSLCPDGSCATSVQHCALDMTWQGCSPGLLECPQQAGLCTASSRHCANLTGCSVGTVVCGNLRDPVSGKALLTEYTNATGAQKWRLVPVCKESCTSTYSHAATLRPENVILHIFPAPRHVTDNADVWNDDIATSTQIARTHDLTAIALEIHIQDSMVVRRFDNKSTALRVLVQAVVDSTRHWGSFREFSQRGTLRSLITVQPLDLVHIVDTGFVFRMAIPEDAAIGADAATCANIVQGMQVLSVDKATGSGNKPRFVDFCVPFLLQYHTATPAASQVVAGAVGNCSCAVNVTHFGTFALIDAVPDRLLQAKHKIVSVLDFFVFMPLTPAGFSPALQITFVQSVANVYMMTTEQVHIVQIEPWPPTAVREARRSSTPAEPSQIRISVRIRSIWPISKQSSSALNSEFLKNGLPSVLSGIILPQQPSPSIQQRIVFSLSLFLFVGFVLVLGCGVLCFVSYTHTSNNNLPQVVQQHEHHRAVHHHAHHLFKDQSRHV